MIAHVSINGEAGGNLEGTTKRVLATWRLGYLAGTRNNALAKDVGILHGVLKPQDYARGTRRVYMYSGVHKYVQKSSRLKS